MIWQIDNMTSWWYDKLIIWQIDKLFLKTKHIVKCRIYKLSNDIYANMIRKIFLREFWFYWNMLKDLTTFFQCYAWMGNIIFTILGDSQNYMPPILVPSSSKCITTQILVIAKLNGRKDLFWEALFMISFVPARNYMSKVSNLSTRITRESCLILKMSM